MTEAAKRHSRARTNRQAPAKRHHRNRLSAEHALQLEQAQTRKRVETDACLLAMAWHVLTLNEPGLERFAHTMLNDPAYEHGMLVSKLVADFCELRELANAAAMRMLATAARVDGISLQ